MPFKKILIIAGSISIVILAVSIIVCASGALFLNETTKQQSNKALQLM